VAGVYLVTDRRARKVTRWLMGIRMADAAVARRCHCECTEAAEHEGENENTARRPGANLSCRGLTVSAANRSAGPPADVP